MINFIRSSLNRKISVLLAITGLVVFAVIAFVSAKQQHSSMEQQIRSSVDRSVDLLYRAIQKPMVVGDDEGTKKEFAHISELYADVTAYLTNYKGEITYSTKPDSLRKNISSIYAMDPSGTLAAISKEALEKESKKVEWIATADRAYVAEVISIPNALRCYHCHGSSEPILGQMVVLQDVTEAEGAMRAQMYNTIALSIGGLFGMLVLAVYFIRKTVISRITAVKDASQKITQGDLDVTFDVGGQDELQSLADNLGTMVDDLKNKLGFAEGVLHGIPVPCGIVGPEYTMLWCNRQICELIEKQGQPEDFFGQRSGLFYWNDASRETLSDKAINEGNFKQQEVQYVTPSGKTLHIHISTTPFYDRDKNLLGSISFWQDLTDIRLQQQTIEEQNQKIASVAQEAASIANTLAQSSDELSLQIDQANNGALRQTERTTEAATAMEEMNATVAEVARNSSLAAEHADQTKCEAERGSAVVAEAVEAITQVHTQAERMRETMQTLGEQADGVGRIMQVIEDIADQTNLLALNAAIEAARAGDAGRGFAVVADEVRKLAERTMEATKEVGHAMRSIQSGVHDNIASSNATSEAVERSTGLAGESGEALQGIVTLIQNTTDEVRSIATAAEQQSASSEEINRSTDEINAIAQETAEIMTTSAQAITELASLAGRLNSLIRELR